jgi:phosphoglycolate phosphatase-like HAD superfamily hydrolase
MPGAPFESKPAGARMLVERHSLVAAETAFVGDGADDAAAAAECGFRFIAATYGYGTVPANVMFRVAMFSEIEYHLLQSQSRL